MMVITITMMDAPNPVKFNLSTVVLVQNQANVQGLGVFVEMAF